MQIDDEDDLSAENEFLRLKLLAEHNSETNSTGNLDPKIENEFLKHIVDFENIYKNSKRVKIFDLLGKPNFKPANDLNDNALNLSLVELISLLAKNNIKVDFSGTYSNRIKYSFIIEELFDEETDDIRLPGMITHFSYEEFHPDHRSDIKERTLEFLSGWFKLSIEENNWYLDNNFILPDKRTISKKQVVERLKHVFSRFKTFKDNNFSINDISFEFDQGNGLGYAEGYTKYAAILQDDQQLIIEGPFKFYLSCDCGWWSIFHIVFPEFEY
jgi:hypothetical protein